MSKILWQWYIWTISLTIILIILLILVIKAYIYRKRLRIKQQMKLINSIEQKQSWKLTQRIFKSMITLITLRIIFVNWFVIDNYICLMHLHNTILI